MNAGAIKAGRAFVELFADNTKLTRSLRQAENQVKAFGNHLQGVGRQLAALGAAASLPFIASTKVFVGFSDQMLTVKAVTGATDKEFAKLTKTAKYLGRTTSYTAAQVASAMVELGRAGFDSSDIDQSIGHILSLARATATELPEAALIASGALRAFGMGADQTGRVVDVLTATANNSAQTLTELGDAMKYSAPIADEYGLTLEQTAKSIGTLANFNIKGSQAGTSFRAILLRMSDPAIQRQLKDLGISALDSMGNLRNIADVMKEVGQATQHMANGQRLKIFEDLFGRRAVAGGAKLTIASFKKLMDAIDNADGTAKRAADTMDSGLGGAFRRVWSAVEGVAIAVGDSLSKALSTVSEWIIRVVGQFTEWIEKNRQLVILFAIIAASVTGVGAALLVLGTVLKVLVSGFGAFGMIAAFLKGTLSLIGAVMSAMLTPMGLVAAATLALSGLFVLFSENGGKAVTWLMEKMINLKNEFKAAWAEIGAALVAGDISGAAKILWLTLKMTWAKGVYALKTIWATFKNFFVQIGIDAFTGLLGALDSLWEKFDIGVIETVNFFKTAWNTFGGFFAKLWERIKGSAQKAWNWIKNLFSKSFDLQTENKIVDEKVEEAIKGIDDETDKKNAELENTRRKKRNEAENFHAEMMNAIAEEYNDKNSDQDEEHQQELDQNTRELAAAQKAWKDAIAESKAKRTEAETGPDKAEGGDVAKPEFLNAINQIAPAIKQAKGSVSGGFSGYGRFGMSGAASDRTLKATEQIAKNTKDLLNNQRDNNEGVIV